MRKTDNELVNNFVFQFFEVYRSKNITVSGPMLQLKAKQVSIAVSGAEFQARNGWLESFQKRHNIELKCISGKGKDVDSTAVES